MPQGSPIVCVAGPTASGKTKLGVLLAQHYGGEIVSADSMQIYRGMVIGTAAPTPEEMEGIPHHMIGIAEPTVGLDPLQIIEIRQLIRDLGERHTVILSSHILSEVQALCQQVLILSRGKLPIVVGGTGLWMEALVRGRTFAPGQAGGAVREALERELKEGGMAPLLAELRRVDPASAEKLHPSDEKRILRALEVYRETGKPLSQWNAEEAARPPRYDAVTIALRWRDRERQRALIDQRVDEMVAQGLLEEVRTLLASVPRGATALQAIGYKEFLGVLDGTCTEAEAIGMVKLRSRQYAKRQLTWFRRTEGAKWLFWGPEPDFEAACRTSTKYLEEFGLV